MFEKFGRIAEQVATNVSRRQFLGRVGGGAMAVAAAVGGLLALPTVAKADRRPRLCGPGSSSDCLGFMEGTLCSVARAVGTCQGPKGGRWTETTICGCTADAPR